MFGSTIHRYIFLLGICTLGGVIMLGEAATSIADIILISNWVFEGKFKQKFQALKSNKVFLVIASLFLLHLVGLLYTSDMKMGLDDVRVKIPMLLLPLVFFSTRPLDKFEMKLLYYGFICGALLSIFWCLFYLYRHPGMDMRDASRFISHIRYGLLLDMAICICAHLTVQAGTLKLRLVFIAIALFILFSMIKLSLVTGLVILLVVAFLFGFYAVFKQNVKVKFLSLLVISIVGFGVFWHIQNEWKDYSYVKDSPLNVYKEFSPSGRKYFPLTNNRHTENGYYVTYHVMHLELYLEWRKRSKVDFGATDSKGNRLDDVLIRYMTSKGLTKDSVGMLQLTDEDIRNVEKGITNYKYAEVSGLTKRLRQLFWEYQDYRDESNPSGNTMLMRFEFWKAAVYIIKRNVWFGVGTGDAWKAFRTAYTRTNTQLVHEWRLKSHNQFLAMTVALGITGLILFLFYLFYPVISLRKHLPLLFYAFFTIALLSFITEDTLESQPGVTFYVYFSTLFFWMADSEKRKDAYQNL
jgi:hypothetical protein